MRFSTDLLDSKRKHHGHPCMLIGPNSNPPNNWVGILTPTVRILVDEQTLLNQITGYWIEFKQQNV